MQLIAKLLTVFLLIYLVFGVFLFFNQKNIIFFPAKKMRQKPANLNIEEVYFTTQDKIKLHAWFLDHKADKTVLFFHGNAGNISYRLNQLKVFKKLNLNALIFDYRGYGKSDGAISKEENLYTDSAAAYNYLLKEKSIHPTKIVIWGRSLGGALAIDIAQYQDLAAVIIESTFSSALEVAQKKFWFLPVNLLARFHFRNDKKINNIKSKILIIHSKDDQVIPWSHGKYLFAKAPKPKKFLEIKGTHNYGFLESYDLYLAEIKKFLN